MSILNNSLLLGASAGASTYQVSRSLRFSSGDSSYLSRTPSVAGNRKTWTWAGWVKRSALGTEQAIFTSWTDDSNRTIIRFNSSDAIQFLYQSGGTFYGLTTNQVFRDVSAWYHLAFTLDTSDATSTNRAKIYVNGSQISDANLTAFSSGKYPPQNTDYQINSTSQHLIGARAETGSLTNTYGNYYLADIHFIDGQALDPSSFTTTDPTTGQLIPVAYSGTYGTNGFHLPFSDNSATTATTLGKDTSGNGNNWTPNNFSVTAGAGNDSLIDSPTNYADGGNGRGNYCTVNALATGLTLSNGNLEYTYTATNRSVIGTVGMSSGKYRWEIKINGNGGDFDKYIGIIKASASFDKNANEVRFNANAWGVATLAGGSTNVRPVNNNTFGTSFGWTWTAGDILGIYFDATNGTLKANQNGGTLATVYTGLDTTATWLALFSDGSVASSTDIVNFGQRAFEYASVDSTYTALNTQNLPAPQIAKPATAMDVKLWTGNGSTQTISGLGFSPDLVWIKRRSSAISHALLDTIRGTNKVLYSNLTAAEDTYTDTLTAFNSDGFTLASDATWGGVNASSSTYVAWAWDAGTSTVTDNTGSIQSTRRTNASAGFSIVTWTGTASAGTVGHGLGVAPEFIIVKNRSVADSWYCYHKSLGDAARIQLNETSAQTTGSSQWNSTSPTSTVYSVGAGSWQASGNLIVSYCFSPVTGYSSFGSYTGNGSADGPFVYTGFRPRWVMIKVVNATGNGFLDAWLLYDSARDTYNVATKYLYANSSQAENSYAIPDFCSNGFKIRAGTTESNQNGNIYIYAAFAESPFAYSRAR